MGLAEPGRSADVERVVGEAGQLGDGEGGRKGQPVAVADHELVERVAGVDGLRAGRRPATRRGGCRALGRPRAPPDLRTEDRAAQACKEPPEVVGDPSAGLVGRVEHERAGVDLAGPQGREPLVPRGIAHGAAQLVAHAAPG